MISASWVTLPRSRCKTRSPTRPARARRHPSKCLPAHGLLPRRTGRPRRRGGRRSNRSRHRGSRGRAGTADKGKSARSRKSRNRPAWPAPGRQSTDRDISAIWDRARCVSARRVQDGRLALLRLATFPDVIPVWFWDVGNDVVPSGHNYCERFPPTWSKLVTVTIGTLRLFNRDHEWVRSEAGKETRTKLINAKDYADALALATNSRGSAIRFLFDLVCRGPNDLYTALSENHSDDLVQVVRLAGIADKTALYGWSTDRPVSDILGRNITWVFGASGFATKEAAKLSDGLEIADGTTMKFPDDSWWLTLKTPE